MSSQWRSLLKYIFAAFLVILITRELVHVAQSSPFGNIHRLQPQIDVICLSGLLICLLALFALALAAFRECQGKRVLRERNLKHQILDELPFGIVMFDMKEQIDYVNPAFSRFIGIDATEIRTWSLKEFRTKYKMYGGHTIKEMFLRDQVEDRRGLLQHRDGSTIPFSLTVREMQGEKNKTLGYLLLFKDLSEERERNRLEQKTHHMFHSIPFSMILIDTAQRIEHINPAVTLLFGVSAQELLGHIWYEALPWSFTEEKPHLQGQVERLLSSGRRNGLVQARCLVHGREYDLELDFFPILDPFSKNVDSCLVLIRDATLAREWEELSQRVDAHSSYVQMAATIAHEVRNPMTSVRGFLQLLGANLENANIDSAQQRMYIDVMQTEIDRMNAILSEYLSMARAPQPENERIHLADLICETLLVLEGEANYRGVTLELDLLPDCVTQGSSRELKQVLINLIRNSFDAMENTQGRLLIQLAKTGHRVQIHCIDNGCGIPEEQLPRIFDPFFTTKSLGTGLGLPVCKKIIESHGGHLHVESQIGVGTTFVIELPLAAV